MKTSLLIGIAALLALPACAYRTDSYRQTYGWHEENEYRGHNQDNHDYYHDRNKEGWGDHSHGRWDNDRDYDHRYNG